MENVGGTFEWSRKQIVAYAGAFNEGDAINVDGVGWVEVTSRKDAHGDFLEAGELNDIKLSINGVGVHRGFISPKGRYLVTTPKDYEVQEGDKLVWLGKTQKQGKRSELTFGKAYNVAEVISGQGVSYEVDDGWCRLVIPSSVRGWGVIPKWENIKEEGVVISIDEDYASPMYTVSFGGTQELPFRGYNLERITEEEESPEQQAFGLIVYFHDQHEVCGRLKVEVDKIAATALEHNDYDTVRRAIDISEKLEERTK